MISKRRNIVVVVVVVFVYIWYYSSREISKRLRSASSPRERSALTDDIRNMITLSSSPPVPPPTLVPPSSSSTPPPSAAAASVNSTGVGRRPDDGLWYDFSDPPSLLFYAYSAFVDDRPLEPRFCNNHFVVIHTVYRLSGYFVLYVTAYLWSSNFMNFIFGLNFMNVKWNEIKFTSSKGENVVLRDKK